MGLVRKRDMMKSAQLEDQPERVSRTEKKKAALAVQDLGEQLIHLSDEQLKHIGLTDDVLKAVKEAKSIKKHAPLARQVQYIGSLMRKYDTAPIQAYIDSLNKGKAAVRRKAVAAAALD